MDKTKKHSSRRRRAFPHIGIIDEKFKAMQRIDVHLPTTDGRKLILPRYTQPEKDHQLLLHQMNLTLPDPPPPQIEELKKKMWGRPLS